MESTTKKKKEGVLRKRKTNEKTLKATPEVYYFISMIGMDELQDNVQEIFHSSFINGSENCWWFILFFVIFIQNQINPWFDRDHDVQV